MKEDALDGLLFQTHYTDSLDKFHLEGNWFFLFVVLEKNLFFDPLMVCETVYSSVCMCVDKQESLAYNMNI